MTIFNLVIPEERKAKEGEEPKTYWHRVGSAFPNKGGGYSLLIPEGVSISGRVLMLKRGTNKPDSAAEAFNEDG